MPVTTDAIWLAAASNRGGFSTGDGSTTFRVPDYNGKSSGSLGAAFLRGDGLNSAGTGGVIQGDAIRNITGSFGGSNATPFHSVDARHTNGAMETVGVTTSFRAVFEPASAGTGGAVLFDASKVVPTAADNHPVNITGCWAVKLFGTVQNAGSADAAALATAVAELSLRVSVLEQRKSTCLVNATGTGAPHETVTAQLPVNIAINSRYVLPNPFGVNTPVECWAEVFANNK